MDKRTENDQSFQFALHQVMTVINYAAPNGKIQRAFVRRLRESEDQSYKTQLTLLVGALHDGLFNDDWPKED